MEIKVTEQVIETICNSLRASRFNLRSQLSRTKDTNKKEILMHQLDEIEEALNIITSTQV